MTKQTSIIKYIFGTLILAVVVFAVVLTAQGKGFNQGASFYKISDLKAVGGTGPINATPYPGSTANLLPCSTANTTPIVKVFSPNGGETFNAGQQITVKWGSCNAPVSQNLRIDVTMPISGGNSIGYSPAQSVPNTGSAIITLPTISTWNQMVYGSNFKITLMPVNANPGFIMDESDSLFTINGPIACLAPKLIVDTGSNYVKPLSNSDILRFSIINQNTAGSSCDQKLKSVDIAYISTNGVLLHQSLSLTGVGAYGASTTYSSTLGGYHINLNQNVVPVLHPGGADDIYLNGTPITTPIQTVTYRGLSLGIAKIEYFEGSTTKSLVLSPIQFRIPWTMQ